MNLECKPVPPEYVGLWRRDGIEIDGEWDTTTRVFWLQTSSLYADIRIPASRPAFDGVGSIEECSPEQLRWLAGQEGFAGCLHVDSETCRWERTLDYQPPGLPDIGRMRFHAGGIATEDGVLAEYREEWRRITPGTQRLAVKLDGGRPGLLVAVDDWFLAAFGREAPLNVDSLKTHVDMRAVDGAAQMFDCELSLGRIRSASAPWEIILSTLPYREGEALFASAPEVSDSRFEGRRPDGRPVSGDVVEYTVGFSLVKP